MRTLLCDVITNTLSQLYGIYVCSILGRCCRHCPKHTMDFCVNNAYTYRIGGSNRQQLASTSVTGGLPNAKEVPKMLPWVLEKLTSRNQNLW